ncbi:MAG: hypothetical protein K2N15_03120 [Lachnospiraceae bacterium]|nr:hypothetical protein [Lachnospiraceae bacterium]
MLEVGVSNGRGERTRIPLSRYAFYTVAIFLLGANMSYFFDGEEVEEMQEEQSGGMEIS